MKRLWRIIMFSCVAVVMTMTTSCGLIDMDFGTVIQVPYTMRLNPDTAYVMEGDTFVIAPVFVPDSVSNREVYYSSEADSVATVQGNTVVGVSEGDTRIKAISVQDTTKAYCQVFVMAPWAVNPYDYSDDMIVYATAKIDGKPFDPSRQMIGAFSGPEFRGMGKMIEWQGRKFLQFRIYGYMEWGDDEPTLPVQIRFACYEKEHVSLKYASLLLPFDGETHGTPSDPIELNF